MAAIDTTNDFFVGINMQNGGAAVVLLSPPRGPMPKHKALRLAAYIVALVDHDDEFPAILDAVRNI